jgi:hypothetical protein
MENTLGTVFAEKEEASAKRDERRCRDKEEQMQCFTDIQRKTLEVQKGIEFAEVKERVRAKKLELKIKEFEFTLLAEESKIMMAELTKLNSERREWFVKKQAKTELCDQPDRVHADLTTVYGL